MDAQSHAAVKAQTKATRNAAARGRRAAWTGSTAPVTLVAAALDGADVLFAYCAAEGDRAHVLRKDAAGRWCCACFSATYSVRKSCRHMEAANTSGAA